MKTKVVFIFMAAILFIGCKPTTQTFTPVEVDCEVLLIKAFMEYGVTTPAAAEVRIINSAADYLPIETEFEIGTVMIGGVIADTLKIPISEIDFNTQQIVAVISERILPSTTGFSVQLNNVIEYENYIEISVRKIKSMIGGGTGRNIILILMPKTSKTIQTEWFFGERV